MAPRKPRSTPLDTASRTAAQTGQGVNFQYEGAKYTRAYVVHVDVRKGRGEVDAVADGRRSSEARLDEICGLAEAIDLVVAGRCVVPLNRIVPATFLGRGKIEDISGQLNSTQAELLIFDGQLSPGQQRNLERAWGVKVLDRTGLILEIFGRRAQTREGALQVELAHLEYQKTRLVRSWTHLERQRGGFGFLGGPGETQIEADRRVIRDRISAIKKQIASIKRTRGLHRAARKKVPYPVVALVGYTNAGKSTLFNRLTNAGVFAKDLLFATLDPTMRQIDLPHGRKIILSDTVGFISDLPTTLVAAFRATLEEVLNADVIVHVRDISHPESEQQAEDVRSVLVELGIEANALDDIIEFWNKADLTEPDQEAGLIEQSNRRRNAVLGSAVTGQGVDTLTALIEDHLAVNSGTFRISLKPSQGGEIAWFYRNAEVLDRTTSPEGETHLVARLHSEAIVKARKKFGKALAEVDRDSVASSNLEAAQ